MDNVGSTNPTPKPNAPLPSEGAAAPPIRLDPAPAAGESQCLAHTIEPGLRRRRRGARRATGCPAGPCHEASGAADRQRSPAATGLPPARPSLPSCTPGPFTSWKNRSLAGSKTIPGSTSKRTDVVAGDITEKKAEPSLIIVVWY